jgi:selenocysteine-specific elongation factor
VNISGGETGAGRRGEVVAHPGQYRATRRVDARLRLLKEISVSLEHGHEVKFFVGASETIASVRLLGKEELKPGEEGWIQLELRDPVVVVRGDRFILRRPSPGETLGGGVIVDHQPRGRHKRFDPDVLRSLESVAEGAPTDVLFEAALALNIAPVTELVARSRLEAGPARSALQGLLHSQLLIPLEEPTPDITSDALVIARPPWNALQEKALQTVEMYHSKYPLRRGIPREELKSRLKLSPRAFNAVTNRLIGDHLLADNSTALSKPGHKVRFDPGQQARVQALMRKFEQSPYSPPGVKELQAEVGEEIQAALMEMGQLTAVSADVVFRKQDYDFMVNRIRQELQQKERITLGEVRDLFSTSRKYAQALLEHLDFIGLTVRDGDVRKLKQRL